MDEWKKIYKLPPNTMAYKIGQHSTIFIPDGLRVGDIVKVENFGGTYPTYRAAFFVFFGGAYDDFHDGESGYQHTQYPLEGLYKNMWKVVGIGLHRNCSVSYATKASILCHLKDYCGRNLVVGMAHLKVIRKSKDERDTFPIVKLEF